MDGDGMPVPPKKKNLQVEPGAGPSSLFILSDTNYLRRFTMFLIEWPPFEYTVLLTIIANCFVLAIDAPLPERDKTELTKSLEKTEQYFLIIFTVEASLKILAMGLILHRGSYLRNMWNMMDFVVVVTGYITLFNEMKEIDESKNEGDLDGQVDLKILRSIRVLRPLKLVSGVPSLQVVLKSIFKALAPLMQIGLLVSFAILIFAIIGLEFYTGALHKTCYSISDLDEIVRDGNTIVPCNRDPPESAPAGAYICNASTSICLEKWKGPNFGITSFDNIIFACITVFQCITMEGWTPLLYWTNDAVGDTWNELYFVPLIVIGSFFMLNLVLGVLSGEFSNERTRVERRETFRKLRMRENFSKAFEGYFQWISKAEEAILNEERTTEDERRYILEARKRALAKKKKLRSLGKRAQSADSEDEMEVDELLKDDKDKDAKRAATQAAFSRKFKKNSDFWVYEKKIRLVIRRAIKQQWFYWSVIVLVFFNTMCVAVEHYNQPEWLSEFLHTAEYIFLVFFICETAVRMWAMGHRVYFESSFNRFDCMVISGSVFEVIWTHFKPKAGSFGLSVLRALRLLRIFKVTKYWSSLRNLVVSLLASMKSIVSLLLLLFLFILIFALLGMQLFGGTFNFDFGTPASNFDSFSVAMLTVFQILTGEDWNEVMYFGVKSQGGNSSSGMVYCTYFIFLTLFGNYTLLNVFLAIAVDSLGQAQEMTALEEKEKEMKAKEVEDERSKYGPIPVSEKAQAEAEAKRAIEEAERAAQAALEEAVAAGLPPPVLPYSSLFIFSSENSFRVGIHTIVTFPLFDVFIMLVIVASSIALAAEDPVEVDGEWNKFLGKLDYGFTCIFAIEVLLKILDYGLILHPGSYMREMWNCMDLIVVSCALTSFIMDMTGSSGAENLAVMKSLRVLRVLRPLKTIKRVPKLKAVFDCVINSLKNVFNILIVYILFHFIFAVIGVQLFNGKFFFCNDESMEDADTCQGEFFKFGMHPFDPPEVHNRKWDRRKFHYDNVPTALLTLFAVQTTEGWPVVLQQSMAVTYEDQAPIPLYRIEMSIFYIVYFIVFPFFFVNIFVALIIITFQEQGEAELQEAEIDKNQKSCIEFAINARPLERYMPEERDSYKYKLWRLVESTPFEYFIMTLIVLNTILLMLKFDGAPLVLRDLLSYMNFTFTMCFTFECVLKLIAFGPGSYFKDNWNTFDFVTVVGSIVDALMVEFAKNFINVGFLRLFRAARLVKLLRQGYTIRILLWTFVQSFKALPYVILLIAMLFFIYAIIGMQVFGNIILNSDTEYNRHVHFQTFHQGLLVLFRCATGEAWPNIMLACAEGRPCDPGSLKRNLTTGELLEPGKLCGNKLTYVFFVSFVFLCSFLMLNLFVAVIMDNFDYLTRDSSILGAHHLDEFIRIWAEYDPSAEGRIYYSEMYDMLKNMDPPLGFGSKCPDRLAFKKLIRMNQPIDEDGTVHFTTTLFALIRENLSIKMRSAGEMDQADAELRQTICKVWPYEGRDKVDLLVPPQDEIGKGKLTVGKIYGGLLILENWKTTKFGKIPNSQRPKGSLLQQIMGLSSGAAPANKNSKLESDAAYLMSEATKAGTGTGLNLNGLTAQLGLSKEMANDKESVISDSYGESYDQSPDAHDYYGRWDSRSPSPVYDDFAGRRRKRGMHGSQAKRHGSYNEYVNYDWEDARDRDLRDRDGRDGYFRTRPRLTRATSSRDSGYYGGVGIAVSREEDLRRERAREREERDKMVRDYIRNGRGWSQPEVARRREEMEDRRKLPRTPQSAINAMSALQGMLGINQGNLASMLSANSSMQNINGSVPNMHQNMVNAVRRLPQIPQVGTVSTQESSSTTGGIFSKLFRRSANNPGLTEQQIQQQQLQLQQQRLLAQQQQQLLQQGGLQSSLSQPQGLASLAGGLAGQQQQQLLAQQQLLQQGGLQVGGSGLLQQQQQNQQTFNGSAAPLTQAHLLLNQQQQQGGLVPSAPSDSLSMQNFHGSMSQLGAPGITVQPPSALGGPPLTVQNAQPARPTLQNLPNQLIQGTVLPHTQPVPQPPPKKPGEGWGGRGARLPKIPVPLPSLPPGKGGSNGYFSHSFEEVEDDLFLDRVVAVGRGSRRLPNPGGGGAPGPRQKRLTRQNGVGVFRRGFSLDSDEYDGGDLRENFQA